MIRIDRQVNRSLFYIDSQGYQTEMSGLRQHHEIYLNDPRKTAPEKLKTVIRHPIVRR